MSPRAEQLVETARYTFGPVERRGVFGGLRAGQTAVLGVGLTCAVLILQLGSSPLLMLVALSVIGVAGFISFSKTKGRTIEEWTPVVLTYSKRKLLGQLGYRSKAPQAGVTINGNGSDPSGAVPEHPVSVPPPLRDVEMLGTTLDVAGGPEIGVVKERRAHTMTATLAVRVGAFGLLSDRDQERRLAAWGTVLAELAREDSPIRRLAWVERTVPNDGDELNGYLQEARDRELALSSSPAQSYIELVESAADVTQDHEILLSLQLDQRLAWRQAKKLGKGDEGALRLLVRELDMLARRLEGAAIKVHGALPPRLYARAIRDGFDPFGRRGRGRRSALNPDSAGTELALAWPTATEVTWSDYTTDSATHATYWMAEWPRLDVGATFLQPLLMGSNVVRTVAVVMEALSPSAAVSEVERARTTDMADEAARERMGQTTTARHRQRIDATARRESELAQGHAELRYAGYVTVSAPVGDEEALDRACAEVEHSAHQSRLGIERLYGLQDTAFTFGLPMGRGLS